MVVSVFVVIDTESTENARDESVRRSVQVIEDIFVVMRGEMKSTRPVPRDVTSNILDVVGMPFIVHEEVVCAVAQAAIHLGYVVSVASPIIKRNISAHNTLSARRLCATEVAGIVRLGEGLV